MTDKPERAESLTGWVTVDQAAREKGVTTKAVYNRIRDGRLSHSLLGKTVVIRRSELDRWEVNRTVQAANKKNWQKRKESP